MDLYAYDFIKFRLIDLVDILIVAYIIYRLLMLVKGTRSAQMMGWCWSFLWPLSPSGFNWKG